MTPMLPMHTLDLGSIWNSWSFLKAYFILASGTSLVLLLRVVLLNLCCFSVSLYLNVGGPKLSPWSSLYPLSFPFDLLSHLALNDVCILMTISSWLLGRHWFSSYSFFSSLLFLCIPLSERWRPRSLALGLLFIQFHSHLIYSVAWL